MKRILWTCILVSAMVAGCNKPGKEKQGLAQERNGSLILTPPAPAAPQIHGPGIYGVHPGSAFLYRIPCTGIRPVHFGAEGLPAGLSLDESAGIITGQIDKAGEYHVRLLAENARGKDQRTFRIIAGSTLALTPPMGWNSWYIHYDRVSDQIMREAADQMVASGMADYGYQYVNIDDCWMVKVGSDDPVIGGPSRAADGTLLANKRFPNMAALTGYVHSKGLKAGIYISPGPSTCAGYQGSYMHELQDATTFASWGFDFLKYDWCSYGELVKENIRENYIKPYRVMSNALASIRRDIVLNLCQYGMDSVWVWGAQVGNSWRTTGDLGLANGDELPGFYHIGFSNMQYSDYARPGAWNDPDYILIGIVGDAHQMGIGIPSTLTPDEQYSYMSMWCLMAAPLIFSGDMARLDAFTLNILCNHEVIEVDQDPLGKQARIIRHTKTDLVLAKEMEDGSLAIGLFNLGSSETAVSIRWADLGVEGKLRIRDLWRQKDLGKRSGKYSATIPAHGVSLVRMWSRL